MEGVGSRLGRASARYGPTQAVFNGPVRKWKKKWVHVPSSVTAASQSNGHNNSSSNGTGSNGSPLLLCKWTPLSSNPSDNNGGDPPDDPPPPKRRFRYTPIAVLEERKKAREEKVDDEARESETDPFTDFSTSKTNEKKNSEAALKKETRDSNTNRLDLGLCLKGSDHDSDSPSNEEDQPMKSTIGDLF